MLPGTVEVDIRNILLNAFPETIAKALDARHFRSHFFAGKAISFAHADDLVRGQRPRTHAAFVSAAVHLALNAHARLAANVECANALGTVDLVC